MRLRRLSLALLTALALDAGPALASIADALDAAKDAEELNEDEDSKCQKKLGDKLESLIDALKDAKKDPSARALKDAKRYAKAAAEYAEDSCPSRVAKAIGKKLDRVLDGIAEAKAEDEDDDEEEDRGKRRGRAGLKVGRITISDGTWDGRAVAEFNPKKVQLRGAKDRSIFFAANIRSKSGDWLEWSSLPAEEVAFDPAEWKDGGVFRYYHDFLRDNDRSNGKFVFCFVAYDADTKEELGRKEIDFNFGGGGGGGDGGGGGRAMDRETYDGFLAALKSNGNEYTKLDIVKNVLSSQRLNAKQLGPILDQFDNEFLKLDAAKLAAPRLVNPSQALGHATKFRNTFLQADYTNLISQQH